MIFKRIEPVRVLEITLKLCAMLKQLHQNNLSHGDLTMENIMLVEYSQIQLRIANIKDNKLNKKNDCKAVLKIFYELLTD
jgi:tRNA A-37 threonylcarbamoyl transferase component Bud32